VLRRGWRVGAAAACFGVGEARGRHPPRGAYYTSRGGTVRRRLGDCRTPSHQAALPRSAARNAVANAYKLRKMSEQGAGADASRDPVLAPEMLSRAAGRDAQDLVIEPFFAFRHVLAVLTTHLRDT
jgi:hypothetical protein